MAAEIKSIPRVIGAFSSNLIYDELGHKLAELAAAWRTHKKPELVQRYHHVLLTLLELGWDDELDVELELPNELMPAEYFLRYEKMTANAAE